MVNTHRHISYIASIFLLIGGLLPALQGKNAPILLLTPQNGATLQTTSPMFAWTTSVAGTPGITYTIRVVRIEEGQTKQAAIQSNPALFESRKMTGLSATYPLSSPTLQPGYTYAWRVIAEQNEQGVVAVSEVWIFRLAGPQPPDVVPAMYYEISDKTDAGYYLLHDDSLRFRFNPVYQEMPLLRIQDAAGTELKGWKLRKTGPNLYIVALPSMRGRPEDLIMLVRDAKGRQYMMRFKQP
ncbi:MAG: hypothetical protein EAZ89_20085 [Bacteroidetes bacterium]|nr:MAG: hypothetical protein EAZ89_20085 [Bacteroidota bacterium]